MKTGLLASCVVLALAWAAAASWSESSPEQPPPSTGPEPITEAPATPNPGDESVAKDPFSPYGTGGPDSEWSYEQLTAEEQEIADRGADATGWDEINAAWKNAVVQQSAAASASAAAAQLGTGDLETGVVP